MVLVAYAQTDAEQTYLRAWVDKTQYSIGDTIILEAQTGAPIEEQAFSYTITDPNGHPVYEEKLTSTSNKVSARIDLVRNWADGKYLVTVTYGNQRANAQFEVIIPQAPVVVAPTDDINVDVGMDIYTIGETLQFTGFINNIEKYNLRTPVSITISHIGLLSDGNGVQNSNKSAHTVSAFPNESGTYSASVKTVASQFDIGSYLVSVRYFDNTDTETFSITGALDLDQTSITAVKDIYEIGERVQINGTIPLSSVTSLNISVKHPNGIMDTSRVNVEDSKFSWSWTIPQLQTNSTDVTNILGFYRIIISAENTEREVVIKVSDDPANDSIPDIPILIRTDKSTYLIEEELKIAGTVIIPKTVEKENERITIQVKDNVLTFKNIYESQVYPDENGHFTAVFDIPITVFEKGTYIVRAIYENSRTDAQFDIVSENELATEKELPSVFITPDKITYNPGETVTVKGGFTKSGVDVDEVIIRILQVSGTLCHQSLCDEVKITPESSGLFRYKFVLPDDKSIGGKYAVVVDSKIDRATAQFEVLVKDDAPKVIFEKGHRIPDKLIFVITENKVQDNIIYEPKALFGSLVAPSTLTNANNVNLSVTSSFGTCIIGQNDDCLVKESTRGPGKIYDTVIADGMTLNVRYNGPGAQVEKFTITSGALNTSLPEITWNVEIIKPEDQISRFYYKITYST